jgi:hypothetical protein
MAEPVLEVELNQLLVAGKVTLPHLAWTFATLNNRVADTAHYDNAAFAACPATGGLAQDQLRGTWTALRDRLQDVLGRSAKSFEAAGDAVLKVAAHYEAADADVAARIKKVWNDGAPEQFISHRADIILPPPPPSVIMSDE